MPYADSKKRKAYQAAYRIRNKEKLRTKKKIWVKKNWKTLYAKMREYRRYNIDKIRCISRQWAARQPKEVMARKMRIWRADNLEHVRNTRRIWERRAYKTRLEFRLGKNLRGRIKDALKRKYNKFGTLYELIGCSIPEFKEHISKKFLPGMTWKNHGLWHLDHILPCAFFDLSQPDQQRKCFHFSNQQPLWKLDNLEKGAKV